MFEDDGGQGGYRRAGEEKSERDEVGEMKEVEQLLQAQGFQRILWPLPEMGAGEGHDLTCFKGIPLAAVLRENKTRRAGKEAEDL